MAPVDFAAVITWLMNLLRGGLIGAAEVVPGVSGGTLALIVGVYRTLIDQAAHIVRSLRTLISPSEREGRSALGAFGHRLAEARWDVLIPIGVGMVAAVVLGARFLEPVLEESPEEARAVFAGLVVAGLVVPYSMVAATRPGRWRPRDVLLALAAAAVAFFLVGLPPGSVADPPLWMVSMAAAVAVCALVLPGVSGSFLLLSVGLYEPTISALNDLDLPYMAAFVVGAVIGLGTFVFLLQWLLDHRTRPTLVILTGLMIGSLRALWPWQDADRNLLPPSDNVWQIIGLFFVGAAIVGGVFALEKLTRTGHSAALGGGSGDQSPSSGNENTAR